jgi:hypothetical protein
MTIERGFVRSIEARNDGWIEVVLVAPHANDATRTLFLQNLDGDLKVVHGRLAKLALLRDALAQTLPVEVDVERSDDQGDLIEDVRILRTRSIAGGKGNWWITGHVIGLTIRERGPESAATPYTDEADDALVAVLQDDGSVGSYQIDLQRRYEATGHAMVQMLAEARRTRRTVRLHIHARLKDEKQDLGGVIVGTAWPTLETSHLDEEIAFIDRIGQRYESLDTGMPKDSVERVTVKFTTAPDQHPEGDISENGSFVPEAKQAWVHQESVLLPRLMAALREGLQVKLGLLDGEIHAVEVISPLGSAAKPIWITFAGKTLCEDPSGPCVNEPTTAPPSQAMLDGIPRAVSWKGQAYFNKGIWRFAIYSSDSVELKLDDKTPCVEVVGAEAGPSASYDTSSSYTRDPSMLRDNRGYLVANAITRDRKPSGTLAHCYLDGLHDVEVIVRGKTCGSPFKALIYRIR